MHAPNDAKEDEVERCDEFRSEVVSASISRLFLVVVGGCFTAATAYVWFKYGFGWPVAGLGVVSLLSLWGVTAQSRKVSNVVASLFASF